MGIYIKGIEMPKDDGRLSIDIFPNGKVCINLDLECNQIATAIPIPTPHGRLKDVDQLANWHKNTAKGRRELQAAFALAVALNDAPTVIEAEE